MKKCIVVYNPQSGKKGPNKNINLFDKIFEKYGYDMEWVPTERAGHAIEMVEKLDDDVDLVLVAGGDGTLNEAIEGNLRRKKKLMLAQLPFGTQNDVAHMYGLTGNVYRNLELVLSGVPKNIDICLLNNKPFVYVACLGAYVDIAYATPRKLKEKYGRLAYVIYAIKQLKQDFHHYEVEYNVDGKEYKESCSFIFITNSNRVAGVDNIYNDIKLNDNKFEVLLCDIKNKWEIFKAVHYLKRRDVNDLPGFKYFKTDEFNIRFSEVPPSWDIDGDELAHNTNKFNIRITKEITMLVPSKNVHKLFDAEEEK